jgi:hypothetical protein
MKEAADKPEKPAPIIMTDLVFKKSLIYFLIQKLPVTGIFCVYLFNLFKPA